MGSDRQDAYRRDGRDSGAGRANGPSRRRDDWDDDYASAPRPRDSMMRGGDTPGRRVGSGPGNGPMGRSPSSGTIGGSGGSGGRVRRTVAGTPEDDDRRSGPSRSMGRPGGPEYPSGPSARAGRGGRPDPREDEYAGSRPAGRTMGQRFRDAGRQLSEQVSAMMESVSRAGRSIGRDQAAMSRGMPVPAVPPGMSIGDLPVAPYRRSRSRMRLRKWRSRRARPNSVSIAIGFFVLVLVLSGLLGAGGAGAV
jgi:hypothetical protein